MATSGGVNPSRVGRDGGGGDGRLAARLELVGKVDGCDDVVNMAVIVPKEDGVITVSDDRYCIPTWSYASSIRVYIVS